MLKTYAKVIVKGSPLSKSNFKLFNIKGRAILPYNSGKYHDRYALYEEEIAYETRCQNPGIVLNEALIAILKVYYKSKKRHPDTNNITKSIFDGIEKSGLIINDAQIRRIIIEEFYDEINPRFELELFGESTYFIEYKVSKREILEEPIGYSAPPNRAKSLNQISNSNANRCTTDLSKDDRTHCQICGKKIKKENCLTADNGKTIICKECLKKLF